MTDKQTTLCPRCGAPIFEAGHWCPHPTPSAVFVRGGKGDSTTQTTEDRIEAAYERGSKATWHHMLLTVLRELGRDTPEWNLARLLAEREEALKALRDVCKDHGDNDWPDDLHLADIIEKHLARHLS